MFKKQKQDEQDQIWGEGGAGESTESQKKKKKNNGNKHPQGRRDPLEITRDLGSQSLSKRIGSDLSQNVQH